MGDMEGGSHSVWTAVALRAESKLKNGFSALMPLNRAINVMSTMGTCAGVVVGVDKGGFCLGPYSVPSIIYTVNFLPIIF